MNTSKITNRRQLAIELYNGGVSIQCIGKNLSKVVNLWISRKEVKVENGYLVLTNA